MLQTAGNRTMRKVFEEFTTTSNNRKENDMAKEAKKETKKAGAGEVLCPECGIPNAAIRMTCEICHAKLRDTARIDADLKAKLYESNKRLKAALKAGDKKLVSTLKASIAKDVGKSKGVYKLDEDGLATQAKSTVAKKAPRPKKEKKVRKCPCCGEETNGFFCMGHDGRVHGMLLKVFHEKMKKSELTAQVQKMYEVWHKNQELSMRELAQKLEG